MSNQPHGLTSQSAITFLCRHSNSYESMDYILILVTSMESQVSCLAIFGKIKEARQLVLGPFSSSIWNLVDTCYKLNDWHIKLSCQFSTPIFTNPRHFRKQNCECESKLNENHDPAQTLQSDIPRYCLRTFRRQ